MTISLKVLNDQIKVVSETNTLLDMLLEFEKTLDSLNLYAFKNWSKGEVLEGPTLSRHYINVKLLYVHDDMPDPAGMAHLVVADRVERGAMSDFSGSDTKILIVITELQKEHIFMGSMLAGGVGRGAQ